MHGMHGVIINLCTVLYTQTIICFGLVSFQVIYALFCEKEEETYSHLFYSCEYAQLIWDSCKRFLELCRFTELYLGRNSVREGGVQLF